MPPSTSLNAEWAGWLQEAADHAANNGSRSCDTYRKAARAIRLHNQPFHHPKQALVLNGVGEGIVRLITSRLQEKCDATGDPFPTEPESLGGKRKQDTSNPSRSRKRARETLTAEERALDSCSSEEDTHEQARPSNRTGSSAGQKKKPKPRQPRWRSMCDALTPEERALDESSSDPEPPPPPKTNQQVSPARPKPRKSQKKYIPKRRTGCWGILVALSILTTEASEHTIAFTKQEIIEHAQKYCEASYTERGSRGGGAGNSGHYTAWNIKKLLAEGLSVSTPGRQAKFTLTQPGFEVASILAEKEELSLIPFDKSKLPHGNTLTSTETNDDGHESDRDSLPIASSSKATVSSRKAAPQPTLRDKVNEKRTNTSAQQSHNSQRKNSLPAIPHDSELTRLNIGSIQPSCRLPHNRGPFEFWYLDRAGSRVRNMDDADTRMHPGTFETLYQVEFAASQNSHPVKRSSIADEATICPLTIAGSDGHMMGWMYESKAIPNCPGFGVSLHSPTLSTSTTLQPHTLSSSLQNTAPSASLSSQYHRPSPPSAGPPVNIIHDESYHGLSTQTTIGTGYQSTISPPDRLFKPSSSGSTTPAGSVISIHSDSDPISSKDPASVGLKPLSRPGSCDLVLSGAAFSETVVGWSASESPEVFPVPDTMASCAGSRTLGADLSRSSSKLSSQQSLSRSSTSDCLPSRRTQAYPKRPPSVASETRPSVDGLPSRRTLVNLKRTPSALSESLFSRPSEADFQVEIWESGAYDICLVLDHREVCAINDRDAFYNLSVAKASALSTPTQTPICVMQRSLVLGDAIWIAVHRESRREVVLDSIVERKRLDDLCASIKDNRFEEQKARLKRSGLRDPIYLVEAYNTQSNHDSHGQMIYTSKFETMLLNDFQLEATPDWKASVEFLIRRTEVLRDLHKTIDLSIIPDSEIDRTTHLSKLDRLRAQPTTGTREGQDKYWVTTYEAFEQLNHKSATLTVRELWARMTHCLPGMSASKVANLVEHWPCPVSFWEDVKSHAPTSDEDVPTDKNPWSWIERRANSPLPSLNPDDSIETNSSTLSATTSTITDTSARIGPALSKRLWELYSLSDYASADSST